MSWHYVERTENDILISVKVNDDSHATVCTVYGSTSPMNDQYVGASKLTENVNLICAAPDLLEALQGMMQVCGGIKWDTGAVEIELQELARKAIDKVLA